MLSKSPWRIAASAGVLLLAAALLYLSLRGIEWKQVWRTVASIRLVYAALSVAIGVLPMLVRAVRWQILLQAQAPVSFGTTFWAVATGYFGNNFLPARGGEFVRSYIVRTHSTLGVSYVLATAFSERLADAVALVILGTLALFFVPNAPAWMMSRRGWFALLGFLGAASLAIAPLLGGQMDKVLTRFPRLRTIARQMLLGMRSLHDGRRLAKFSFLTLAIWLLDAVATTTLAHSLSISIPILLALLLIVALSLSSALPSTPGYVGVYQFVAVTVLKPFGISPSAAIAFILVTQAISYVMTSLLGLLAVTRYTPLSWRSFRHPPQPIHIQS